MYETWPTEENEDMRQLNYSSYETLCYFLNQNIFAFNPNISFFGIFYEGKTKFSVESRHFVGKKLF